MATDNLVARPGTGIWQFRKMIDGVMVNKSTRTTDYKLATKIAAQFEAEAVKRIVLEDVRPLTLSALKAKYLASKEGLPSHRNIKLNLDRFSALDKKLLTDVKQDEVQSIVNDCRRRGLKEATLALMVRYWNSLQNYAMTVRVTPAPKVQNIRNFKGKDRFLSEEEEEALLEALKVPEGNPYWLTDTLRKEKQNNYDLVVCLLELGCRDHEASGMLWSQVDFKHNTVHIKRGKGGIDSSHFITDRLMEVLKRRRADDPKAAHIFPEFAGKRRRTAWMIRATKRAGITSVGGQVTLHTLRHTYANRMLRDELSPVELQQLLGHKNITTTMQYVHVNPTETARKALAAQQRRAAAKTASPKD